MCRLTAALLIVTALPLAAQSGSLLRLELKCRKSPCTFQTGESIPIELRFSSSVPKHYQLNMATSDRSGRTRF
jgi:hypothetical protein